MYVRIKKNRSVATPVSYAIFLLLCNHSIVLSAWTFYWLPLKQTMWSHGAWSYGQEMMHSDFFEGFGGVGAYEEKDREGEARREEEEEALEEEM